MNGPFPYSSLMARARLIRQLRPAKKVDELPPSRPPIFNADGLVMMANLLKTIMVIRHGTHNQKRHGRRFGSAQQVKETLRRAGSKAEREAVKQRARQLGGGTTGAGQKRLDRARANVAKEKKAFQKDVGQLRNADQKYQKMVEKADNLSDKATKTQKKLFDKMTEVNDLQEIVDIMHSEGKPVSKKLQNKLDNAKKQRDKLSGQSKNAEQAFFDQNNKAKQFALDNGAEPSPASGIVKRDWASKQISERTKELHQKTKADREVMLAETQQQAQTVRQRMRQRDQATQRKKQKIEKELEPLDKKSEKIMEKIESIQKTGGDPQALFSDLIEVDSQRFDLWGERNKLDNELNKANRKSLFVDNAAKPKVKIEKDKRISKFQEENWTEAQGDFNNMVGTGMMNGVELNTKRIAAKDEQRAFHRGGAQQVGSEVFMGKNDQGGTLIHEFGHAVERHDPFVSEKVTGFLNRRTRGDKTQKLSDVTKNDAYANHEVTTPDKFFNPYIGKRYNSGMTEVTSMGLEHMWKNPSKLAKDDPEMFDLLYGLMRS